MRHNRIQKWFTKLSVAAVLILSTQGLLLVGCATPPTETEAPAEYDQEPAGVYRGVVAKEAVTGTFSVRFFPESAEKPVFHFSLGLDEGRLESRASGEALSSEDGGTLRYSGVVGAGEQELSLELSLELGPEGSVTEALLDIDGAPAAVIAAKEKSDQKVLTFEGRFSGTSSGIWNMLITGETALAAYAEEPAGMEGVVRGRAAEASLFLQGPAELVEASGRFSNEGVAGSWSENLGEPGSGRFQGRRSPGGFEP